MERSLPASHMVNAAPMRSETDISERRILNIELTHLAWQARRLVAWLFRSPWFIPAISTLAYLSLFKPLYDGMGSGTAALAAIPVLAASWLLGPRMAFITGLLVFPLNTLLLTMVGHTPGGWDVTIRGGGGPGMLILLIMGVMAGLLHVELRQRRAIQEALRLQSAALASAANGIVIADRNGIITWVNPAFTRLTGYTSEEAIGRNPRFLKSGRHDKAFYKDLWDTILSGQVWHGDLTNRRKDGQLYTEDHTITPVRDDQGKICNFVSIKRDVTEERANQRQLQQQERLAAVGQLAAGIAHDFNNSLAVITLYSQMLQRTADISQRNRERLDTIFQQAQHASGLTQQIVDFSRRSIMERKPMDMIPFVKELMKLWQRILPEHIDIELSYGEREYVVNADPTRLQQALMNLALNARDAMPDGGALRTSLSLLLLSPDERPPQLNMKPGRWLQLDLSNSGPTIPPDTLPHIFEPFFTTKAPTEGTGLGLAQVYGIVKQHDGEVTVKSREQEPTTFTIYLPLIDVAKPDIQMPVVNSLMTGGSETILLVEDEKVMREATMDVLENAGYQVLVAENGRKAMEMLADKNGVVDLVLSDLVMPDMGGVELFREIQSKRSRPRMIIMTGYPLADDGRELLKQGIVAWVKKPIPADQLIDKVRSTLAAPS